MRSTHSRPTSATWTRRTTRPSQVAQRVDAQNARLAEAIRAGVETGVLRPVSPEDAAVFLRAACSGVIAPAWRPDGLGRNADEETPMRLSSCWPSALSSSEGACLPSREKRSLSALGSSTTPVRPPHSALGHKSPASHHGHWRAPWRLHRGSTARSRGARNCPPLTKPTEAGTARNHPPDASVNRA